MAEVWDRWEKGESLNALARDLGRGPFLAQICAWSKKTTCHMREIVTNIGRILTRKESIMVMEIDKPFLQKNQIPYDEMPQRRNANEIRSQLKRALSCLSRLVEMQLY